MDQMTSIGLLYDTTETPGRTLCCIHDVSRAVSRDVNYNLQ